MTSDAASAWDAFVAQHPDATFFHHACWRTIVSEVFGHRPHYLTERDSGGAITAILPLVETRSRLFGNALISNAFCVGGGPLARDTDSFEAIVRQAEALGRRLGVDYVEMRDLAAPLDGWASRADLYANFARMLPADEDENLKQIPRRQRAVLRKAIELGMTSRIDPTPATFYGLYARTMRGHGTPALPRKFFERLLEAFGDDCEILTVCIGDRPISSVLSYYFRDRAMPYYTGSAPEARGTGGNDLLYWHAMRRAAERGCTIFDFGRSKVGTGPYSFKRNWGFEPRPITHQYRLLKTDSLPEVNPTNPRYALMINAWRRLPLPVANAIGPLLSRSLA